MKTYMAYYDYRGGTVTELFEAKTQNQAVNYARRYARDHNYRYMYIRRA